jgi:hypothetical protein
MNCVVEAVNKLFNFDSDKFPEREVGYALCDIQRMIHNDFSVWIVYANHTKCINFDLLKQLPKSDNYIPLFLFKSIMSSRYNLHCEFALYDRNTINIDGKEYDADEYFKQNKIIQVAAIIKFETHEILSIVK